MKDLLKNPQGIEPGDTVLVTSETLGVMDELFGDDFNSGAHVAEAVRKGNLPRVQSVKDVKTQHSMSRAILSVITESSEPYWIAVRGLERLPSRVHHAGQTVRVLNWYSPAPDMAQPEVRVGVGGSATESVTGGCPARTRPSSATD